MNILSVHVENFGSYPELEMTFGGGLHLIYGKTGAGKSTIMDAVAWCLYGQTAKGGSVDEIRSWQSDEDTTGEIVVSTQAGTLTITRIRGKSNDLYWREAGEDELKRGSNLQETQKLINDRLGVDAETYTSAAYFHEFSPTGSFFVAKAKERRELFEQLAALELPNKLMVSASDARKKAKSDTAEEDKSVAKLTGALDSYRDQLERAVKASEDWEKSQAKKLIVLHSESRDFDLKQGEKLLLLEMEYADFETKRDKVIDLTVAKVIELDNKIKEDSYFVQQLSNSAAVQVHESVCPTCSQVIKNKKQIERDAKAREDIETARRNNQRFMHEREKLEDSVVYESKRTNPYSEMMSIENSRINTFGDEIIRMKQEANPYYPMHEEALIKIETTEGLLKGRKVELERLQARVSGLTQLITLAADLRAELLKNAVQGVQDQANEYLEKYFDSEIRLELVLGSDSLEAQLQCHGYTCSYKQLSKGQRGLLKLCFGISVMKAVANNLGTHFQDLFFDESLDGLDAELKVKAFSLFEQLSQEHENIMIIDHAQEFQSKFERKLHVTMEGDVSKIEECFE